MCVCVRTRAEREVVLSNLDTLCSVALGESVTEDYLLARDTVITICNITDQIRVCTRTLSFLLCWPMSMCLVHLTQDREIHSTRSVLVANITFVFRPIHQSAASLPEYQ